MADTEDFEALLRQYDREHPAPAKATPQAGDHVRGTIISIDAERAFVDLGGKVEGSIDIAELTDPDGTLKVAEGDSVEAVVISNDERTGTLLLGTGTQRHVHDTGELEEAFRSGLPVEGLVSAVTKGGLEVQVAGLRAFCPASQADIRFVEDLEPFVGQHLSFRVTRIEGGRRPNVVLSRRAVLEEERAAQAEAIRARLEPGAVLRS
ncbi:MAG: S1 RNA-binding domain-containing protein, partial [Gammaproteobacteria bacterium]|nr:S1 RNA-binding domain-containing protein [Gammaproteobacteria bacterium]